MVLRSHTTQSRRSLPRRQGRGFERLEPRLLLAGDISQVNYFDTWNGNIIKSTDPASVVYHPSGHLFIADSEINELSVFTGKNVFEVSLTGDHVFAEYATGNDEPTGITYNERDGFFYITNDDTRTISRYDASLRSALAAVSTQAADAVLKDPEGITSDPSGNLYVVNGVSGQTGRWVAAFNSNMQFLYKFSLTDRMADAEGIAYNRANQHLYIVSQAEMAILEYTLDGTYLETYDIGQFSPRPKSPQGLTFGATSYPYDDPAAMSIYIADGGVDNQADGGIFEASIGSALVAAPHVSGFAPTSGPAGTVVTITGSGFAGTTGVFFNGTAASSFTVDSATTLHATVPPTATSGPVRVTNPAGSHTSTAVFTLNPAPLISSFSPLSGPVGTEVTLLGGNFVDVSQVRFNGVAAGFTVDSSVQLRAVVPPGAASGPISVTNAHGAAASAADFTVLAAPEITVFTPASGPAGTEVTLQGKDFTGVNQVRFNGIAAASLTVDSATQLRARVPAGATTGPVEVSNAAGGDTSEVSFMVTSLAPTFTFPAESDAFVRSSDPTGNNGSNTVLRVRNSSTMVSSYLKFQVSGVSSPIERATLRLYVADPSDSGGAVYRVSDNYRDSGTLWNEGGLNWSNAPVIAGSPLSSLGAVAKGAWAQFDVTAAVGGSGTYSFALVNATSDVVDYSSSEAANPPELVIETVAPRNPHIASFAPLSGPPGTEVTVQGLNFSGATAVRLNGIDMVGFVVDSASQFRAVVPAGATSGPISVVNPDGTATSAASFAVLLPPEITAFTPASGQAGTEVTISGRNLTGTTQVLFNGTAAVYTVDSDSQLRATVPDGATTGPIQLTNGGGTQTSATPFTVLAPPRITSFSPVAGPVGRDVTLLGVHFNTVSQVLFNGTAASFTVDSASQLRAVVPAGAASGPISVVNPDGTAASASDFTVLVAPEISSLTPASGPVGTEVTLSGANFRAVAEVRFNGIAAAFTVDSPTQLRAIVPPGATTGRIVVSNAAGSGASAANFKVTIPPRVVSIPANSDAYVRSSDPTRGYGSYSVLRVRNSSTTIYGYLKFDASSIDGPVERATVRLYVADPSNSGGSMYLVSNN
ncbi:MAG: IPT/TIG domain-containing protein [Pirellulales bacterium]|nr:IPT/TIG domain-containing protein [Pirellulales bacterium]